MIVFIAYMDINKQLIKGPFCEHSILVKVLKILYISCKQLLVISFKKYFNRRIRNIKNYLLKITKKI